MEDQVTQVIEQQTSGVDSLLYMKITDLSQYYLRNSDGAMAQLSSFVAVMEVRGLLMFECSQGTAASRYSVKARLEDLATKR